MWLYAVTVLVALSSVNSENSTLGDTCDAWDAGPFSLLLEEWATSDISPHRQGRVMALPPTKGYYVTERIDMPLVPPPPPHGPGPSHGPPRPIPLQNPNYGNGPMAYNGPHGYKEWESPPGNGKIVNKPPNKDKFRPSFQQQQQYQHQQQQQQQQHQQQQQSARPPAAVDRVDEPPRKQVTETDLYLLTAIEKLVWRADTMEKRLRKLEESMHLLVAGTNVKPEPCEGNYTRVGAACVQWSRDAADWQGASRACRRRRAALLELPRADLRLRLAHALLADPQLRGEEFWTGGLNPGLLWIWSHSAKPVEVNATSVVGDGRCLALVPDAARQQHVLRGHDCALKHRYICQLVDADQLANEIEKTARTLTLDRARRAGLVDASEAGD